MMITENHVREGIGATAGPLETDRVTGQILDAARRDAASTSPKPLAILQRVEAILSAPCQKFPDEEPCSYEPVDLRCEACEKLALLVFSIERIESMATDTQGVNDERTRRIDCGHSRPGKPCWSFGQRVIRYGR